MLKDELICFTELSTVFDVICDPLLICKPCSARMWDLTNGYKTEWEQKRERLAWYKNTSNNGFYVSSA